MGSWTISGTTLKVVRGNLAEQNVDAVVLGVGEDFRPDGPASGAVFGAAGEALEQHLGEDKPVEAGEVRLVPGFELPAERIFLCSLHPASAVENPEEFLASCVRRVLGRAADEHVGTLSMPPLGLGDYGYPIDRVSRVAVQTIRRFVEDHGFPEEIRLVVYDAVEYSSVDNFAKELLEGTSTEKGKGNRPNLQF